MHKCFVCDESKHTTHVCGFCKTKLKQRVSAHVTSDLTNIICDLAYDTIDYTDMKLPVKKMNKWQQSFMKKYS